jgi:hypothetical protein
VGQPATFLAVLVLQPERRQQCEELKRGNAFSSIILFAYVSLITAK